MAVLRDGEISGLMAQPGAWSAKNIARRLECDVFPHLGREITPPGLLACLRRIEAPRGAIETAHRILQTCGQVFRDAVATSHA